MKPTIKIGLEVLRYLSLLLVAISVIFLVSDYTKTIFWIILAVGLTGMVIPFAIEKASGVEHGVKKGSMYQFFFYGMMALITALMIVGAWGIYVLRDSPFKAIALVIVVLWACVFLAYFIWAVYFYNINYGITEEEWDRINTAKEKKMAGQVYSVDDLKDEPRYNPYDDQTFGLPPGTVRGMIAFTLLFGALAMLVLTLDSKNSSGDQQTFRDEFEFFKTAFLMMIAFYFGSRSLEYLMPKSTTTGAPATANTATALSTVPVAPGAAPVIDPATALNPMAQPVDPATGATPAPATGAAAPIDPMA